jgi:hypothetical protein
MKIKSTRLRTLGLWQSLIIGFAAIILVSDVAAQGICVPDTETIRVNSISGKVVHVFNDGEGPVLSASVTIIKGHNNTPVIATQAVNADGRFSFDHIKPGKYRLKVSDPHLLDFYLDLIVKRPRTSHDMRQVVIILGADLTKPCGGSSTELRVKTDGQ